MKMLYYFLVLVFKNLGALLTKYELKLFAMYYGFLIVVPFWIITGGMLSVSLAKPINWSISVQKPSKEIRFTTSYTDICFCSKISIKKFF